MIVLDLPLGIAMILFFVFLGPVYSWGMLKVFRYVGNPVMSIDSLYPLRIKINSLPWAFLWPNAAVMGILTVVSFVFVLWQIRGGEAVTPYQAYFDLAMAFVSAYTAMAWTDYKMRGYEQERREAELTELKKEIEQLKKTNIKLEERLQDTTYLFTVYRSHFTRNQLIENDLAHQILNK